MQILIKKQ